MLSSSALLLLLFVLPLSLSALPLPLFALLSPFVLRFLLALSVSFMCSGVLSPYAHDHMRGGEEQRKEEGAWRGSVGSQREAGDKVCFASNSARFFKSGCAVLSFEAARGK